MLKSKRKGKYDPSSIRQSMIQASHGEYHTSRFPWVILSPRYDFSESIIFIYSYNATIYSYLCLPYTGLDWGGLISKTGIAVSYHLK